MIDGCRIEPETECRGANLAGAFLLKANLARSDLREVNLEGADLREVNLRKVDLTGSTVTKADVTGGRLQKSDLDKADFRESNLTNATLKGASAEGTNFAGTLRCRTTRTNGTVDNSGCAEPFSPTPTPAPGGEGPKITQFDLPSFVKSCKGGEGNVNIEWATKNAIRVNFEIDGERVDKPSNGWPTSGDGEFAFKCNVDKHTYTLIAQAKGKKVRDSGIVRKQ